MGIFHSLAGMMEVELTSADPAAALRSISSAGIPTFQMRQDGELTLVFSVTRFDFRKLRKLADKRGEKLTVRRRYGIFWAMKRLEKRPVLIGGVSILLAAALFLPSRIFFIRVEGNAAVPTRQILSEAEKCGIVFGASRRTVRSEKMKNALLASIPELQWAGINTKGCLAVISVREKTSAEQKDSEPAVSGIVACRDGVIVSCTVEKGNTLCKVGQAVRKGELLVSGYTDCGISIRATRSVGEIFAQTSHTLDVVTPGEYAVKGEITGSGKRYALLIGKKRINFYKDSGISNTTCDKMSEVKPCTLPGGFTLPVALVTEQWISYKTHSEPVVPDAARILLEKFSQNYLKRQMIAGEILHSNSQVVADDEIYRLNGRYACCEMIGREKSGEILEENGQTN